MLFGRVTNAFDHSNSSGRWDSYYKYPYLADEKIGGPEHWQVQGHIASICIWQSWSTWPMYRSLNWWLLLSGSVIFDSLWPHILEHTGFLCPWDSPGKATRVGSHFLYQGSSLPRDRTCISCLAGRSFTTKPPWKLLWTGYLPLIFGFSSCQLLSSVQLFEAPVSKLCL